MKKKFVGTAGIILVVLVFVFVEFSVHWNATHPSQETLRNDIFAEKGFHITSQQQTVTTQFTLQPSWIPSKNGETKVIHKVFYDNHMTQLYVDTLSRDDEGDVTVIVNSKSTFSKGGGTFVSPIVVVQNSGAPDTYTFIPWHTGWMTKKQIPRFSNAINNKQFILNFGSGEGPGNQLGFTIQGKDVKKYFSTPVTVTIPDFNLISYSPDQR